MKVMMWAGGLILLALAGWAHAQEMELVKRPPAVGTFYLLSAELNGQPSPPFPFDPYQGSLPVYEMEGFPGSFVVADSPEEFQLYTITARALTSKSSSLLMSAYDSPPSPGEGDGDGSGGGGLQFTPMVFGSNDLWLEIEPAGLTNGWGVLTIHNPAALNNPVWDVWATTNLSFATAPWGLSLTNWGWLARTESGQTNVSVPVLSETECFFRIADPGNDSDGDGLSDYWSWSHFGHANGWAVDQSRAQDDYDGDGVSNLSESIAGTDPNTITFTLSVTNGFVNVNPAPVWAAVSGGVPTQLGALLDSTNFGAAIWTNYTGSNLLATLGPSEGWHELWLALHGRAAGPTTNWQCLRLKLDTTAPGLTITSPDNTTSQPLIQLQGQCFEALASLRYDLGGTTNHTGFVLTRHFDTNTCEITTNTFQVFDLRLAPGANTVTLRATDLAGNVTVTNLTFTLVADGTAPVLSLTWPKPGQRLAGSFCTIRGILDDATACLAATVTGSNGETNRVSGLVERDGKFWLEDVPLKPGTNVVILTAVDAWTNTLTTNLTLIRSGVVLTIDPVAQSDLWTGTVTVTGTVSDPSYSVWVNGRPAIVNSNGTWYATDVPLGAGGIASIGATAYPPGEEPSAPGGGSSGAGGAADNPDSPNAMSFERGQDKPSRLFVAVDVLSEVDNIDSQGNEWGTDENLINWWNWYWWQGRSHNWEDGQGGTGGELEEIYSAIPSGTNFNSIQATLEWPGSSWPDLSNGTRVETGPNGSSTSVIGPTTIGNEYCNISDLLTYHMRGPLTGGNGTGETHARKYYSRQAETLMKLFTGGKDMPEETSLWVLSGAAAAVVDSFTIMPPAHNTTTNPIAAERITIGEYGNQDSNARLYAEIPRGRTVDITARTDGPAHYTRSTTGTEPQLLGLTVVSNAVNVGSTNWAAVKKTNEYVFIEATLSIDDTNVASRIKWTGGEAVPGNPFQRHVTKAASVRTPVIAKLGTNTLGLNVWIIWADVTVKVAGTLDPDNKAEVLENGQFPTAQSSFSDSLGGGTSLGPIDRFSNTNFAYAYAAGKMEAKAVLKPGGIGMIITNGWNMARLAQAIAWDNGGTPCFTTGDTNPPAWINDTGDPIVMSLCPTNDKIFDLDWPACPILYGTAPSQTAEVYDNFHQYVTVNLSGEAEICSNMERWSYMAHVDISNPTNKIPVNVLQNIHINLPINSHFSPR